MVAMSENRKNSSKYEGDPLDEQLWTPYIGIAMELHARTAAEIASLSVKDLETRFAFTLRQAEENLGRELVDEGIERRIDELPANVILSICAEVLGDDRVTEPLLRIAEVRRREAERAALLAEIEYDAKNSWRFDFRKVPQDEIVKVGFFRPYMDRSEKSAEYSEWAGRTITARMVEPETGLMEVVEDVRHDDEDFRMEDICPTLADHARFSIGVPVPSKTDQHSQVLSPVVTHGTVFTLATKNNWYPMKYDIGYVTIGGFVALSAPQD